MARVATWLLIAVFAAAATAPARADLKDDGKALITDMANRVIVLIANKKLDRKIRSDRLGVIFRNNFDLPTIARWVMGRAWRDANAGQRQEYMSLFERYVVLTYTLQLERYSGEKVLVLGAEDDGKGVAVASRIVDPKNPKEIIAVKWRLRPKGGRLVVRDVIIENISMSLNQRREFANVYQREGSVDGFIKALRRRVESLERGGSY